MNDSERQERYSKAIADEIDLKDPRFMRAGLAYLCATLDREAPTDDAKRAELFDRYLGDIERLAPRYAKLAKAPARLGPLLLMRLGQDFARQLTTAAACLSLAGDAIAAGASSEAEAVAWVRRSMAEIPAVTALGPRLVVARK